MRFGLLIVLIMIFSLAVSGQTSGSNTPLTQAEYVRLLYQLETRPSLKKALIDAIRKRGIGFELTSGLRSLTTSKSRNDSELRRTLEEANRRRQNPEASKLPDREEALEALEKTRRATLAAVEEMPDFVVKQKISRSVAFAGTGNFRNRDNLIVAVSYRSTGEEEYELLSVNGVIQDRSKKKASYSEVGGTSSTGEFVSVLATVFRPESKTRFRLVDTDVLRGNRSLVFDFSIDRDKARQQITSFAFVADSTISGMTGRIWIDREKLRVLRLESKATEIPSGFPVTAARRTIDYEWVSINDQRYLLPSLSDVRLTFREKKRLFESRNRIQFKDYQKFGTEVIITDEDDEEIPDPETPKNQPPR